MIWFLPIFSVVLGGLAGSFLAELVIWITNYLDKQSAKKHIQEQKRQKHPPELNKMIKDNLEKENYNNMDIGLGSMLESSNSPIYRVPARDEMINILVNEHRCDRVRLENLTDRRLKIMYGIFRGKSEKNFNKQEIIDILVKRHGYQKEWLVNKPIDRLQAMLGELPGKGEYVDEKQEIIDILLKRHGYQ